MCVCVRVCVQYVFVCVCHVCVCGVRILDLQSIPRESNNKDVAAMLVELTREANEESFVIVHQHGGNDIKSRMHVFICVCVCLFVCLCVCMCLCMQKWRATLSGFILYLGSIGFH